MALDRETAASLIPTGPVFQLTERSQHRRNGPGIGEFPKPPLAGRSNMSKEADGARPGTPPRTLQVRYLIPR